MTMRRLLILYADTRMAKILFLGFLSGFPWLLIGSMLTLWLKEEDLSRSGIGLFGVIFSVYAVNALWAPLVDKIKLPVLHALGQRRSWILLMQAVIALALIGMYSLPGADGYLWWVALFAFIIALASATQDIAIDAARIEMIAGEETHKIGAGSAMATSGWWLGFGGGKVIALPLVAWMQEGGITDNAWQAGYLSMVVIVILSVIGLFAFIRPSAQPRADAPPQNTPAALSADAPLPAAPSADAPLPAAPSADAPSAVITVAGKFLESTDAPPQSAPTTPSNSPLHLYSEPLLAFIRRYTLKPALLLLGFIIFFKIGEAFLGRMSVIFYKEIGFSISEIALLSGGLGTVTVCLFAVFGSFFNARYGLMKGIILSGIAMASTNLLFAALAYHPEYYPDKGIFAVAMVADLCAAVAPICSQKGLFTVAVVADQFTTSVSTVAFVAFISQLCDRRHTATHYAALASLGNLSRTVFAASSGILVDKLELATIAGGGSVNDAWALFFIITMVAVLPSLYILRLVRPHILPLMRGATTKIL